jgi:hypothetical protein
MKDASWLSMQPSDVKDMQPELFTRENNPAATAKLMEASPFKQLNQAPDKFEMQTKTYRGFLEKDKQESKQQIEVQEKLYQLINGPVLNMLKESALNSKTQVSHLEQTSKGIASLGNAPRNNVVVSSVKNSINSFGGSNTLTAKANALGAMGITV